MGGHGLESPCDPDTDWKVRATGRVGILQAILRKNRDIINREVNLVGCLM